MLASATLTTFAWPGTVHGAATISVNTTSDVDVADSQCTLREAIIAANTNASYHGCIATGAGVNDEIVFNNLGSGTPVINIDGSPLPQITEWVTIDGDTGGSRRIELRGPGTTPTSGDDGILVASGGFGTTIRNLVIDGFNDDGVWIDADEVTLAGNYIGTDSTGAATNPNLGFGVQVQAGNGEVIGGTAEFSNCLGDCNIISGNGKAGILVDLNATGTIITGNHIGTDVSGTAPLPNLSDGVYVKGAGATIGGGTSGSDCSGPCNLISGNEGNGVNVDAAATQTVVKGNFIGTDVHGASSMGNDEAGVEVSASGVRIGGTNGTMPGGACTGDCNLISGNSNGSSGFPGIRIENGAINVVVQGTFIGTDVTGDESLSNGGGGVGSLGANLTVGGTSPSARNVISGNAGTNLAADGANSLVQGNYVGTNSAGTAAVPGNGVGVYAFQGNGTVIGGTASGAGNLISGASENGGYGVLIQFNSHVTIQGNFIGTKANGSTPLPNLGGGVKFNDDANDNIVGGVGPGMANVIASNSGPGVDVDGSQAPDNGNLITGNSIYNNSVAGIFLENGGNGGIHAPIIDSATAAGASGTACKSCTIEVFSDQDGQGRMYEGSTSSDSSGNWTLTAPLTGPHVTATATDVANNTSEFSERFELPAEPTPTPSSTVTPTPSSEPTPVFVRGDANCSGALDLGDVTAILSELAGVPPGAPCSDRADTNCSGTLEADDALLVLTRLTFGESAAVC